VIGEPEGVGGPRHLPVVSIQRGEDDLPLGLRLERLEGPWRRGVVGVFISLVAPNLRWDIAGADDVLVELPRRGEPWAETSLAIHSSQRLVDLPEQQQLAVVRGARCVARIDALGEGDRRDGLARLGDQCAFEGGRVRRWRQDDWCWRR